MIQGLPYEPVLSEYSDILYDPRTDAQASCLKELETCDMSYSLSVLGSGVRRVFALWPWSTSKK
jgi:hypothetical protein